MAQRVSGPHPHAPSSLVDLASSLIQASITPASAAAYHKVFMGFSKFCRETLHLPSGIPAHPHSVLTYIAHLFQLGYASSSIHRMSSIIAYYHKLLQFRDPTQSFLIKKILVGVSKSIPSKDLRSPITPSLLQALVSSCSPISTSQYIASLLSSMYLLAFHAFLRVGEITVTHSGAINPNLLHLSHVSVLPNQVLITFHSFKHHSGPPSHCPSPAPIQFFVPCPICLGILSCAVHPMAHYLFSQTDLL
jgi:hypothetical protein